CPPQDTGSCGIGCSLHHQYSGPRLLLQGLGRVGKRGAPGSRRCAATLSTTRLPRPPLRMVGRDREVHTLARRLREQRFVSIVGACGMGKTTVAVAVAHEVLSEFAGAVQFLDLAAIQEPQRIGATLATQLGLT